ncbi:MAG: flagellin, partial [Desulfomonilia bacterium]|nr:flagellin [Desulfomonilia bacterium]
MALRINTNVAALNAHRQLLGTEQKLGLSMERLSSGFRINRASDDAAGLAVANRLRTNIRSLTVASRNVTEAKAMVAIAEGAANQVEGILERMKELATQAASDNAALDRSKINAEFESLSAEIVRIVGDTEYQGTKLIDGTFGNALDEASSTAAVTDGSVEGLDASGIRLGGAAAGTFTISQTGTTISIAGPEGISQEVTAAATGVQNLNFSALGITLNLNGNFDASNNALDTKTIVVEGGVGTYQVGSSNVATEDEISVSLGDLKIESLGSGAGSMISDVSLATRQDASAALTIIDDAIDAVGIVLGDIGAVVNRFDYTYSNLQITIENFSASESIIRDVDM